MGRWLLFWLPPFDWWHPLGEESLNAIRLGFIAEANLMVSFFANSSSNMASLNTVRVKLVLKSWAKRLYFVPYFTDQQPLTWSCPSPVSLHWAQFAAGDRQWHPVNGFGAADVAVSHFKWLILLRSKISGDVSTFPLLKNTGCLQIFHFLRLAIWQLNGRELNAAGSISGRCSKVWQPSWKYLTNNLAAV